MAPFCVTALAPKPHLGCELFSPKRKRLSGTPTSLLQLSPPTLQIYPVRCSVYDSVKMINLQDLTGLWLCLYLANRHKAQAIAYTGKWLLAGIFIEDPLQRCTFKRTSIGHSLRFSSEGGWRSRADEPIEFETLEAPSDAPDSSLVPEPGPNLAVS